MCVGVPGKVIMIEGERAKIEMPASVAGESHSHWIDISPLEEELKVGDYLIAYQDTAVNRVSAKDAEEILKLMDCAGDTGVESSD